MSFKKNNNKPKGEWYKKPWTKLIASILGISSIFGIGLAVGSYKENLDWKIEKIQLVQEYNEKLQKQMDDCMEGKLKEYQRSAQELERLANELKKRINEK